MIPALPFNENSFRSSRLDRLNLCRSSPIINAAAAAAAAAAALEKDELKIRDFGYKSRHSSKDEKIIPLGIVLLLLEKEVDRFWRVREGIS